MGVGPLRRSESHWGLLAGAFSPRSGQQYVERRVLVELPNPNPENFTIERIEHLGSFACAMVHYPDATNFEGRKIIVFKNATEQDIANAKVLDPHFSEDGNILARFRPDEEGWQDALAFTDFKAQSNSTQ